MYRLSVVAIAAIASFAWTPTASAAPPVMNWTGFYVGANVGGGWHGRDLQFFPDDTAAGFFVPGTNLLPTSASFNSSGAIGGLQFGYNWQLDPRWLIGVETDFDASGIKGSSTNNGIYFSTGLANTTEERIKWLGTLRARLGYLPAPEFLAYITGGLAYGSVERSASLVNTFGGGFGIGGPTHSVQCNANTTCFAGSANYTAMGWTLGGGFEYALGNRWTVKAEYLYINLSGKSITETALALDGNLPASTIGVTYSRMDLNVARLGVNYRF